LTKSQHILWTALLISAVFIPRQLFAQEDNIRLVFAEDVVNSVEYPNTDVARGHVEFKHGTTRLFCDSALYFRDFNLVHAYSNVQINQGDTVNLFCDSLKYNGNTNISKLLSNVRFRDNEYLMLTDSLEYDGNRSVGYYTNHAHISSIKNDMKLTSVKGYYYSESKIFYFKDSVHLEDEKYELFADTLEFRTIPSEAHFHGPTTILMDTSRLECKKGFYNTKTGIANLWSGATFIEKGRILYADSLYFDQPNDIGEGFCNVMLFDSTENVRFLADYMLKKPDNAAVTLKDNARILQYSETDTLRLAGDTINYHKDTLTDQQISIAENNVSIIKGDLFILCDSAYFSERDSILKLHKEPILWNNTTQLFSDSMHASYYDKAFHEMTMYQNAMLIGEHEGDSIHYDQMKGKKMIASLDSNQISSIHIIANAQALYYPEEKQKEDSTTIEKTMLKGANRVDCNSILFRFLDGDIQSVAFLDEPTSVFYPMNQIPEKELFFKGFSWEIERKPLRPIAE
jgi:hypothetical protein